MLVHTVVDVLHYPQKPSQEMLADPMTRREWLLQIILSKPMHPHDKNFSIDALDLHGYRHLLAKELCGQALKIFQNPPFPNTLVIVFGKSNHNAGN